MDAPASRRRAAPWPQPRHLPCLRAARDPLSRELAHFGPQGSRWGVLGAIRDLWGPSPSFKARGPRHLSREGGRAGRWWPRGALARAAIVVDAVFGTGVTRPIDGDLALVIAAIAAWVHWQSGA